jgi:hypothetical protein
MRAVRSRDAPRRGVRAGRINADRLIMGRGPSLFREADVVRAARAARKAGLDITRIEIDDKGRISVVVGRPVEPNEDATKAPNEWDEVLDGDKEI